MGVINITQRSERLGNIGGTSAAHGVTSTDIGTVHHTVARTFAPHYYSRNYQEGNRAIGRGLGAAGDTMLRIGLAIQQREEDRQVDEYTNAMLRNMEKMGRDDRDITDWNTPQRRHLEGQKRGFYLRTGKGTMNVVDEWETCFGQTFDDIGTSIGANERVRERTMKNLAGYRRGVVGRLADLRNSEYRRIELGAAEGTLSEQVELFDSGRDEAVPDIFKQYDRVSQLKLLTPEQAKAGKQELALKLASSVVGRRVTACQTAEDFDRVEAAVKSGLKDALPDEIAANLPGGDRTVGGKMKDALLTDVRRARQSFEIQRDREEREELSRLVAFSDNALARGGMDDLEAAYTDMSARAKDAPKGSRMETVALQQKKRLDMAADAEAQRLTWDAIIDHADDKEPWTPTKGGRMEKFYKPLKEAFDRQRAAYDAEGALMADAAQKESFKANEAQVKAKMMELGAMSPGLAAARLAAYAANGHITLDQYNRLKKEQEAVWSQKGMPDRAAELVRILKQEFFLGNEDYDPQNTMGVSAKTGKFEFLIDPATKKPFPGQDAEWQVESREEQDIPSGFVSGAVLTSRGKANTWRSRTLTSDEQLRLLDWGLELAKHDGEELSVHPLTNERLDKPFTLDAAAVFRDACTQLLMAKDAEAAQGLVEQRAKAMVNVGKLEGERQSLLVDVVNAAEQERAEAKSALKQTKRKPFMPKMPSKMRPTDDTEEN